MENSAAKIEFEHIARKLISLGEDQEELQVWLDLFESLTIDQQKLITANLKTELEKLEQFS